jgi:hypothetical protein
MREAKKHDVDKPGVGLLMQSYCGAQGRPLAEWPRDGNEWMRVL